MSIRAAVDVGGIFTDVVVHDDVHNRTVVGKTLSTPTDLTDGVFAGFRAAPAGLEITAVVVCLLHAYRNPADETTACAGGSDAFGQGAEIIASNYSVDILPATAGAPSNKEN